jgi:hypothetical protein
VQIAEVGRASIVKCGGIAIIKDMNDRFDEENVSYYAQALLIKLAPYAPTVDAKMSD